MHSTATLFLTLFSITATLSLWFCQLIQRILLLYDKKSIEAFKKTRRRLAKPLLNLSQRKKPSQKRCFNNVLKMSVLRKNNDITPCAPSVLRFGRKSSLWKRGFCAKPRILQSSTTHSIKLMPRKRSQSIILS